MEQYIKILSKDIHKTVKNQLQLIINMAYELIIIIIIIKYIKKNSRSKVKQINVISYTILQLTSKR